VGQDVVVAGGSTFVAPIAVISMQELANLPSKNVQTLVIGLYQYCDELGNYFTRQFMLGYRNAASPDLNFYLVHDEDFRIPRPDLSPCETIAERQQNEQQAKPKPTTWQNIRHFLRLCK
jgi:hypothetical protein